MKQNLFLALGSSLLLWLAWPPIPYTAPLLFIAFLPLLLAVENIIEKPYKKKGRKVFLLSGLTFFLWNTASIFWVFNAMNAVMPVVAAFFIALIPFTLGALLMALTFVLYYKLRQRYPFLISALGLISLWISYEYLHQSWSLAFPWMTLGNGFATVHPLIQWYEYTGVYGGSLWILSSNLLAFAILKKRQNNLNWKKTAWIWVAVLLLPCAFSLSRYLSYQERINPADVVVVQPNIDPYKKYYMSGIQHVEHLISLSDSIASPNTEFFIWPETAVPEFVNEETIRRTQFFDQIQRFLYPYKNASLLTGIETYKIYDSAKTITAQPVEGRGFADHFNAAMLAENSGTVQFYHKSKLVPGVETMPFMGILDFLKPLFARFGGTTGGYGRQDEPSVFYAQSGIGTAPIICFESIWGAYVGEFVQKGAQFIAVITNDAWWGDTPGKEQHLQYAKLRALETRRWVARSANTGISAFINQRGDIVQRTPWFEATAIHQEINLNERLTFYVRYGDYIAYIGLVLAGISVLSLFRKKRNPLK